MLGLAMRRKLALSTRWNSSQKNCPIRWWLCLRRRECLSVSIKRVSRRIKSRPTCTRPASAATIRIANITRRGSSHDAEKADLERVVAAAHGDGYLFAGDHAGCDRAGGNSQRDGFFREDGCQADVGAWRQHFVAAEECESAGLLCGRRERRDHSGGIRHAVVAGRFAGRRAYCAEAEHAD